MKLDDDKWNDSLLASLYVYVFSTYKDGTLKSMAQTTVEIPTYWS